MNFRQVSRIAFVCSLVGIFTACGESSNGETGQTNTGSPDDTSGVGSTGSAAETGATNTSPATTPNTTTTGANTSGEGAPSTEPTDDPNPGFCPEAQPEAGAECTNAFPVACTYADVGCVCAQGAWDCYSASDCPAAAPADGDACELGGMACSYAELGCTCDPEEGWSCSTACPEAQPTDGLSCRRPTNQSCGYAAGVLTPGFMGMPDTTCACTDEAFVCFSEANCPSEAPITGGECAFPTLGCEFEGSDCTCNEEGTWECITDCPASNPDDGASCERPEQAACRYSEEGTLVQGGFGMGMGGSVASTCTCSEQAFVCIGQEDCPAEAPASASECADLVGLACDYEASSCTCGDTGWTCQTDCPAAPPEDGISCERSENQACRYAAGELLAGGGFGGGQGARPDTSCSCVENAFDCFTPADCPTALPAEDEACTVSGVQCAIEGQNCFCSGQSDTWICVAPETDAGVAPVTDEMTSVDVETTGAPVSGPLDAGAP